MKKISEQIQKTADAFLQDIRQAFGESLRSVILYGPAARGEIFKDRPHINFMVVVEDNTPSSLARCAGQVKKWRKRLIMPLFLDSEYIGHSLDTFPLEFMDMKASYRVLHGEDVLEGLTFEAENVRRQCERELKGKLLHLRAEYLALRGDTKLLVDLIHRSLNTFRLVFAGLLFLKGCEAPEATRDMMNAITEEYGLSASLFKQLNGIAKGDVKVSETEADKLFDLYVEELEKLSESIDEM